MHKYLIIPRQHDFHYSNFYYFNSTNNTFTASMPTTVPCGGGSSDAISTFIDKDGAQTKWGPCGGVIHIIFHLIGVFNQYS